MGIAAARFLNFGLIVFDRALKVRLKLSARSVRVFRQLLRMIDNPEAHDGLKRELFAIPGASGFSDQQMQQAIARVLNDHRTDAQ
jgi:hypothetical protein